ncbi:MAG: hypothetical protein GF320_20640 [Armatimonadia bacterium]|nr:hypothetical protein [Armatimonadia bacterium]
MRWIHAAAVIPVAALLMASCAGGGATPPPGNGDDDPVTGLLAGAGALNGYVSASASRADIGVELPTGGALPNATVRADTGQVGFTNESGAYWITGVPRGEHTLTITAPGVTATKVTVQVESEKITSGTVAPGSSGDAREGALNGYVYEGLLDGRPELSAGALTGRRPIEDAALSVETGQTARTDAQGFFHIGQVPAGIRVLTMVADTGTSTETVNVPAGRIASGTGQLPRDWGACRGFVGTPRTAALPQLIIAAEASEVNPVAGALVQLGSGETALAGSDGSYAFSGVATGNPSITARSRGGLEATEGLIIASGVITEGLTPPAGFVRRVGVASTTGAFQVPVGGALWLTANALDPASQPYPAYTDFTWRSENTAVATVDVNGVVTARRVGTATIVASAGGADGEATITVNPVTGDGPHEIEITAPSTVIAQGSSAKLTARALDSAGAPIPDSSFVWRSTDASVAPVTAEGVVGGASVGTATILCTSGGLTGSVSLAIDRQARRIVIEPAYLAYGDTETAHTVSLWDGAPEPGVPLLWSIDGAPEWLTATPSSGSVPALVDVEISRQGLAAGVYVEPVTVGAPGGNGTLTVEMAVSQARVQVEESIIPEGTATIQVQATAGEDTTTEDLAWTGGAIEALVSVPSGPVVVVVSAVGEDGQILAQGQTQAVVERGAVTDVAVELA